MIFLCLLWPCGNTAIYGGEQPTVRKAIDMNRKSQTAPSDKGMSFCERYHTLWKTLCIVGGIARGKVVPWNRPGEWRRLNA